MNGGKNIFQFADIKNKCIGHGAIWSVMSLIYVVVFSYLQWETSDDFLMSLILGGVYGEKSPYTLVMSYPFGFLVTKLQDMFPYFNWLTIIEILCVMISFGIFISMIYEEKDKIRCAVLTGGFVLLEISFLQKINYTRSACLIIFAGGILLCRAFCENRKKKWAILGIFFVIFGCLIRSACIYLSIPFVCVFFFKDFLQCKKDLHPVKKFLEKNIALISIFIALFAIQVLLGKYNTYIYQNNQGLASYVEFNRERSKVADYLPDTYDEKRDEFEKIGFSQNDFYMMKSSICYDDVFNQDLYEKLNSSLPRREKSIVQRVGEIDWIKKLGYYSQGRRNNKMNLFFAFVVCFLVSLVFANRKSIYYILLYFGATCVLAVYFVISGRFPPWIQDSLYMIGIFCIVNESREDVTSNYQVKKCMVLVWSVFIVALGQYIQEVNIKQSSYVDKNVYQYMDYMQENKENVYLIDNFLNCPFPIIDAYGTIKCMEEGSWSNIIRVGNWYIKHPVLEQQLQGCYIQSPIYSLLSENTFLLTNINSENIMVYKRFFQEHYNQDVKVVRIERWGDYALYSFEKSN